MKKYSPLKNSSPSTFKVSVENSQRISNIQAIFKKESFMVRAHIKTFCYHILMKVNGFMALKRAKEYKEQNSPIMKDCSRIIKKMARVL